MSTLKTASLQHPDASANAVNIDTSGNVGIGTASPTEKLDVSGNIRALGANSRVLFGPDGFEAGIKYATDATLQIASRTGENIAFTNGHDGTERMRIDSNGKVGIGTTTPNAKLHIGSETEPNTTNQSLYVQGSKAGYAGFAGLPMNQLFVYDDTASTLGSGGAIGFGANTGSSQRTWIASINSERESATNDASNYAGSLVFYTRPAQSTPLARMQIDSNGRVTMPYQPSFKAYTSGGQINTNAVDLVFNNTSYAGGHNVGGHYNTSNGRFTAPIAGYYLFSAAMLTNPSFSSNSYMIIYWRINGSSVHYMAHNHNSGWVMESGTFVVYLSANDYVNLYMAAGSGHYGTYSHFSGRLLG